MNISDFFKSFNLAANLNELKTFMVTAYSALQKLVIFINFTKDELTQNNVGANILAVLPSVLSVISTILGLIVKFGPLLGLVLPVGATFKKGMSADELNAILQGEITNLNKVK